MRADEKDGVDGVRVAARRKLEQELGIKEAEIDLASFKFMTKIHYKAPSDGIWGEHEGKHPAGDTGAGCTQLVLFGVAVDYILLLKQDVAYESNPNEVQDAKYYTPEEVHELLDTAGAAVFFE
jgi:isopentenyl-diphosphate delta-isomerase